MEVSGFSECFLFYRCVTFFITHPKLDTYDMWTECSLQPQALDIYTVDDMEEDFDMLLNVFQHLFQEVKTNVYQFNEQIMAGRLRLNLFYPGRQPIDKVAVHM